VGLIADPRDPLGEAGGINLYEYALSNPVNFVDPLGLSAWGDFFGGVADGLTFGLSTMALGSSINQCSKEFSAGVWVGFGGSLLLTGGGLGIAGRIAVKALAKGGAKKLLAGGGGRTNAELVQQIATRAQNWGTRRGLGEGGTAGSLKHGYAKRLLERYQNRYGQRGLHAESSWINHGPTKYGKKGSTRLDVWEPGTGRVYDYKFGNATMSSEQLQTIMRHGPFEIKHVIVVRP
jgi:hypothetical protein